MCSVSIGPVSASAPTFTLNRAGASCYPNSEGNAVTCVCGWQYFAAFQYLNEPCLPASPSPSSSTLMLYAVLLLLLLFRRRLQVGSLMLTLAAVVGFQLISVSET